MNATHASSYPSPGEVIDGKYRIEHVLGEGGMGAVMAAYHTILKSHVALKFISPDMLRVPGAVERFMNEGVAARGIQSDHVVRIDDVGLLPSGLPFIVMEMLQGCDLSELLEREAPSGLPVARAIHFVLQILRGLHVAHSKGIVHRDLKPSNAYVIQRDGEPDFIKLLDFGISKITQEPGKENQQLTQTNTGLGTPLYMSPEQARNAREANARSDLYSVSAILYELLTGRTPYQAESPNDLLYKLFTTEPDPILTVRPDLPPALATIIHQGLSKDPAQRPGSSLEFADLLIPFADARSTDVVARIRATAGGGSASTMLAADRSSSLPAIEQVPTAQTAVGVTTSLSTGSAKGDLGRGLSFPAKLTLMVGVLAIVGGSAVLLTRPSSSASNQVGEVGGMPPTEASIAVKSALPVATESAPSASTSVPSLPQVTVVTVVTAAASVSNQPPPPKVVGPVNKQPVGAKKNPFGVGIVELLWRVCVYYPYTRFVTLLLTGSFLIAPVSSLAQGAKTAVAKPAKKKSLKESLTGEALDAFNRGVELYKNQNFEGAKAEFEQAFKLSNDLRLLFNVAIAERDSKHYSRAVARLEQLLKEGSELSEKEQQDARDLLEGLKQFTAPITISSNEADTVILVDNVEVGKTPLAHPIIVDVGERNIIARKQGFLDANKRITVSGGREEKIDFSLEVVVKKGILSVKAGGAPVATVFVDGVEQGPTPWQGEVLAEKHTIELRAKGYVPEIRTEVVAFKGTTAIEVAMRLDQGKVHIETDNPDNTINVNGNDVGKGTWDGILPSGAHSLRVTRSGAEPHERQLLVQTDQLSKVQVTLRSKGGVPWYAWVIGGGVLIGGGIGTYFLVKPGTKSPPSGSIPPGTVPVWYRF